MIKSIIIFALFFLSFTINAEIKQDIINIESKVIDWRRDFHQNPELSNREFRTSKIIADHLKSLGLEVQTGIAHTGVVGFLQGDLPGQR